MKKKVKVTLITLTTVVVLCVCGWLVLVVMILLDPNAESFSELFSDWFSKQERVIEVYPFDITCVEDTTSKRGEEDFAVIYTDARVRDGRTIVVYVDKSDYDTIQTLFTQLHSLAPQSPGYQQSVTQARAFQRKIVYDNYPIIYQHCLRTDADIKEKLSDIDYVKYY